MSTQKNTKALLLFIALITLTPFAAHAQEEEGYNWHIGIDAMSTFMNYSSPETNPTTTINWNNIYANNLNGFGLRLGWRIGPYLGWEMGYYSSFETEKNDTIAPIKSTQIKLDSLTWDILGFYPLDEEKRIEIIGAIGFANTTIDEKTLLTTSTSVITARESEIKPRIGIGLKYGFTQNLALRTMARWQDATYTSKFINSMYILTLGIDYSF